MRMTSERSLGAERSGGRLREWLRREFSERQLVILANREPVRHDRDPDGMIRAKRSTGGLVSALEPLIEACHGIWVAHGTGTADRFVVDDHDQCGVPQESPRYRLRRVWLDSREERGYYDGFANEGLWPLCHVAHVAPIFRSQDFAFYKAVNAKFAEAACEEATGAQPVILVQDYHFALAPRRIRAIRPDATIAAFWHIPWPHPRQFAVCPWRAELLSGLLGSSVVGFQTDEDRDNFTACVRRYTSCAIDDASHDVIHRQGRTAVRVYPVSVEWPSRWTRVSPPIDACRTALRRMLNVSADTPIGVGVDRFDYTKGIAEKFLAVERLLEHRTDLHGRFVFVQVAEPTRDRLSTYREVRTQVTALAARINRRFGAPGYTPIVLRDVRHEPAEVFGLLRAADFCYVASLHDGMNLVAKEFVAARDDQRGVLVLSEFAGAARELVSALIVNPYDIDEAADAMDRALTMPTDEQRVRMCSMRAIVAQANAYHWVRKMLTDARDLHLLRLGDNAFRDNGLRARVVPSVANVAPGIDRAAVL
jgi:trehalose 6-phosphate synthase